MQAEDAFPGVRIPIHDNHKENSAMTINHTDPKELERLICGTPSTTKTLREKRHRALIITAQHTAGNMLLAAIPIPLADGPILVMSEGIMVARILSVYDLDHSLASLAGIFTTIGGTLLSCIGTMTAGNLLKCVPGAGSAAGGVINALVAGSITGILGLTTIGICERVHVVLTQGRQSDLQDFLDRLDQELDDALRNAFRKANGGIDPLDLEGLA